MRVQCTFLTLSQFFHSRNVVTAARCLWSAASRKTIKRTSFLLLSQLIFYSSSFSVLIGKFRISRRAPLFMIPINFQSKSFLLYLSFLKNLPVFTKVYVTLTSCLRHKSIKSAYLQKVFIPVSRYVKVLKIHQDFPEL